MINNSPAEYAFIRCVIVFLQNIGPVCIACTAYVARNAYLASTWPQLSVFKIWCLAETLFYVFFLWYRTRLQREATHPPLQSVDERREFFCKIASEIHDPVRFMSGWFKGARFEDIGREDMKDFLNWVFWEGRVLETELEELEDYTQKIEALMGSEIKPGRGTAKPLRLTIDPIDMECRSMFWYLLMLIVDTSTHVRMSVYGYQYHRTTSTSLGVFPPRPATLTTLQHSPSKKMSYWLRPHTSRTRLPILFIHGIGVGLYPYVEFLHEIDQALNSNSTDRDEGQVGILAIEILQLSSRLTGPILGRDEFLTELTTVLDAAQFKQFVLASHSYGSVSATHILTHEPLVSRVASTLFIDPVTMLLHMPDVAYNFTARKPQHANEWQLWYFGSKDPGVAYTLGRHFHWKQNLLWREHIMDLVQTGTRVTASLASRDLIVDTQAVGTYLTQHLIPDPIMTKDKDGHEQLVLETTGEGKSEAWKSRAWEGKGLEVLWYDGLDHAQVFDTSASRARLVDVLVGYSQGM